MKNGMKIGMVYPQTELKGDPGAVRAMGDAAVDLGYDYLLAYDHVVGAPHDREPKLLGPYDETDPFHDPFVLFSYLAGRHDELEFASGVIILPQRQTVLVAKQAADLDLMSGERFRLGVGVGWNYVEYDALGQDFSTRGRRANEQIEFMRQLWTEEMVSFEGEFDRIDRGNVLPRPTRSIPVYIGGFADAALRRGVRHGDGFMFAGGAGRAHKSVERLREFADEEGRDLTGFGIEYVKNASEHVADAVECVAPWADAGGTHFAAASMNLGFTSLDEHLTFFEDFMAGLST